jgi:hypothetical protein
MPLSSLNATRHQYLVLMILLIIQIESQGQTKETAPLFVTDFQAMAALKSTISQGEKEALKTYQAIIDHADAAMTQGPFSVVHKTGLPPSGDKHDYLSMGPYWWPNPDTPDQLPYIRRDGEVNPEARNEHTDYNRKNACFRAIGVLGRAYYYSGEQQYAEKALELMDTWFIDPETKMNPNLNYGQGVPGRTPGRPFGIIEFRILEEVIKTLEILKQTAHLPANTEKGMHDWLTQFANWLQTSDLGVMEGTRKNNHATWYDVQLCKILLYLGEVEQVENILEEVKTRRIAIQIEPDGSQPLELARTKSFSYSTMNLAGFTELARLGRLVGVDLWHYETDDGRSIRRAYEFMLPYVTTDKNWEYQQLEEEGDYKERFRELLARAAKEFEDAWLRAAAGQISR